MRGYVGTLVNMPESVAVAERCIKSCAEFGVETEIVPATTKADYRAMLDVLGVKAAITASAYSDPDAVLGNFCTQFRTWVVIASSGEPGIVLEHDAVMLRALPPHLHGHHVVNLGKPSFGRFNERRPAPGVYPLFSKSGGYFPGAHAYLVNPSGARLLIAGAYKLGAQPCDLFLHRKNFVWLQELWPWPFEAHDDFSTIQRRPGCLAKHRFSADYRHL